MFALHCYTNSSIMYNKKIIQEVKYVPVCPLTFTTHSYIIYFISVYLIILNWVVFLVCLFAHWHSTTLALSVHKMCLFSNMYIMTVAEFYRYCYLCLIYATGIIQVIGKLVMKNVQQVCHNQYDL